MFPVTKRNKV